MDKATNEQRSEELKGQEPGSDQPVLSPDEMNTLLTAYQSADKRESDAPKTVRTYDFARPDRFSRDQLKAARSIHETFAAELAAVITEMSSQTTRVELSSLNQSTYGDFRAAAQARTVMAEISLFPQTPVALMEVSPDIVGPLVDYLCGGSPTLSGEPSRLTEIDLAVAEQAVRTFVKAYDGAWPKPGNADIQLSRITDGTSSSEEVPLPSEAVLVCGFEVQMGNLVGMITLCLPALSLESILPAPATASSIDTGKKAQSAPVMREMRRALDSVEIPCSVVLGKARISLADMTDLGIGDVIRTEKRAGLELEFKAGEQVVFRCRPGVAGNNLAVVISGVEELENLETPTEPAVSETNGNTMPQVDVQDTAHRNAA